MGAASFRWDAGMRRRWGDHGIGYVSAVTSTATSCIMLPAVMLRFLSTRTGRRVSAAWGCWRGCQRSIVSLPDWAYREVCTRSIWTEHFDRIAKQAMGTAGAAQSGRSDAGVLREILEIAA